MEQEDVNVAAEQTVQVEASPTEEPTLVDEQPIDVPATPVSESTDTGKVSPTVPYDRFAEVNSKLKEKEERLAYLEAMQQEKAWVPPTTDIPELDEQSAMAVDHIVNKRLEERIESDFQRKHREDLSDRLVKTAYDAVIRDKMASRVPYIDRDDALREAKDLIDSRLRRDSAQAKNEGVEEGQKLAQQKQQLGAVGETGKAPEVSDDNLSSAELAKKYNLPVSH